MKPAENYVRIATHQCPVCGAIHKHNTEILLHKRLREIPKDKTLTGYGLCEEHDKLFKNDFIALIEVSNNSDKNKKSLKQEEATRTGRIMHMKRSAYLEIFNLETVTVKPLAFITVGAFSDLYDAFLGER